MSKTCHKNKHKAAWTDRERETVGETETDRETDLQTVRQTLRHILIRFRAITLRNVAQFE